jgi:RNA 2',3'-cyclic 3'-phosphodiesterase
LTGNEPARRLFFALWPDAVARRTLHECSAGIVRECGGREVPESNLHATLAFLGAVPVMRVAELGAVARLYAVSSAWRLPLELEFREFAHWAQPQVLVAIATPSRAVGELAEGLKEACARQGFTPDLKPFRAHVTVARKVRRVPRAASLPRGITWAFDEFALIESRTAPAGPIYSVVETYVLVKPEKTHESP